MKESTYTESRPLRVFTAFSGYDSQCMALDRLGIPYKLTGWSEIDKYAIQAHNAIYPQWADRNAGDISKIDWNKVPDFDLLTYSFPCTCISVAGKQEGFEEGSGTASSLLWECRKAIVTKRPKYLLMENVMALVSYKFKPLFMKWQDELASYGYTNFIKVLNAKDYGVPQNRERVFMVSILDDNASFHFPEPFPLERRLKDILEENVDAKYYLSDKLVRYIFSTTRTDAANQTFISEPFIYDDYNGRIPADPTITQTVTPDSGSGTPRNGQKVVEPVIFQHGRGYIKSGTKMICPSITTSAFEANNVVIEPVIAAMRGHNPENPSDRTAGVETEQRLEIGGDVSNTLTSVQKDNMVVEPVCLNPKVDGKQPSLEHRVYSVQGISTAVTTGFMPSIAEPQVLTPKRNEYGKSVRKAYESGEVDESRHNMTDMQAREDGIANTLTSVQKDNLLLEVGNYIPPKGKWKSPQRGRVFSIDGISPTLDTMQRGNSQPKIIEPSERQRKIRYTVTDEGKIRVYIDDERKSGVSELQIDNENACASTVTTAHNPKCYGESTGYRIRKLTPRECFRLMDVDEENIDRIQDAGISNSQQYKLAGNSIVVSCLYHIFRKLFVDKDNENNQLTLF